MKKLEGKVAIITGASGGLGKHMAIRFAEEGAKIAICARTVAKLEATAKECESRGAEVFFKGTDLTDYNQLKEFVDGTIARFGTVDILVNNAISISSPHPFLEHTIETLDQTMHSGLYATWHMMQLCFPYMKDKASSIINFGSGAGDMGMEGYAAYAATKEAICALTRVVAREWGQYGIRANSINPSAITDNVQAALPTLDEEMRAYVISSLSENPMKRPGDSYSDVAPVAVFLAGEDSRWITGQNIMVEGGGNIHA